MSGERLVGRDREVRAFLDALERIRQGTPVVLLLPGIPGRGRSTLLRHFGQLAADRGVKILRDVDGDPHFAGLPAGSHTTNAEDAALWFYDDLHLADEAHRQHVERLLAEAGSAPDGTLAFGVVLSIGAPLSDGGWQRERLAELGRMNRLVTVPVSAFTVADVAAWLTDRFGVAPGPQAARLLWAASAGNPRLLVSQVDHLEQIGALQADAGGLALAGAAAAGTLEEGVDALLEGTHPAAAHWRIARKLINGGDAHADQHSLTIAYHLLRAEDLAEPETILRFAAQAGQTASEHHSHFLAGRFFEAAARAAGRAGRDRQSFDWYRRAGEAYQRWSDGALSDRCLQRAAAGYQSLGDVPALVMTLQALLRNRLAFGDPAQTMPAEVERVLGLLADIPDDAYELKVRVHDTVAAHHIAGARYDLAEFHARTAMTLARESGMPQLRCIPVTSLALAQFEQLRIADASHTWLEGLAYDRLAGESRYEGFHLQRLPVALYCLGEVDRAATYNQASYVHNRLIGNTGELSVNLGVDAMIANLRGDWEVAVSLCREAMAVMATTRYLWPAPTLLGALAFALTMQGRFDEAHAAIDHLSRDGLLFEDTSPYRATAARLRDLVDAHRPPQRVGVAAPPRSYDRHGGLRAVRAGSVARLCMEAELALLRDEPWRLDGTYDALEFVHRRGVVLSLGWSTSVPRALAVAAAVRGDWAAAQPLYDRACAWAKDIDAPAELGRLALHWQLARRLHDPIE